MVKFDVGGGNKGTENTTYLNKLLEIDHNHSTERNFKTHSFCKIPFHTDDKRKRNLSALLSPYLFFRNDRNFGSLYQTVHKILTLKPVKACEILFLGPFNMISFYSHKPVKKNLLGFFIRT